MAEPPDMGGKAVTDLQVQPNDVAHLAFLGFSHESRTLRERLGGSVTHALV